MTDLLQTLSGETIAEVEPIFAGPWKELAGVKLTMASGRIVILKAEGDEEGFGTLDISPEDEVATKQ